MHSPLLATLTHARLRIAQGDLAAARDILRELLEREPGNNEAWSLLQALNGRGGPLTNADTEPAVPPRQPANAGQLRRTFGVLRGEGDPEREGKIRRLRAWASRMSGRPRTGRRSDD